MSEALEKSFLAWSTKVKQVMGGKDGGGQSFSPHEKGNVYGLYKQATEGDASGGQPWGFQVEARLKYDSWEAHKGKSTAQAMTEYVQYVQVRITE
jgi:acyl-CoA-binding protein